MKSSTVVLLNESSANGTRHLSARIDENGDLCIDGQDLGSGVGQFWGEGSSEYEWCITVQAAEVPRVIAALGGAKGDDVLALLAEGTGAAIIGPASKHQSRSARIKRR